MADINVDVNLPSTISVDVTSPTQALSTNISIPGPQGPRGEKGNPTSINSLTAENIIITGANGNIVSTSGTSTIFISGNSGYFESRINTLTTNLDSTGSNLLSTINTSSGYLQTQINNLDTNYATDSQLISTGSTLDNKITSLSGYVNSQDSSISNNLTSTGTTLISNINTVASNLSTTGNTLNTKIDTASGYLQNQLNNLDNNYATDSDLISTGQTLNQKINTFSGTYQSFVDNLDASYATDTQLQNTGSTLSQNINSLSGTLTNNYYLKSNPSGFITGVDLSSYLTSANASSTYATITNLASTGSSLQTQINNLDNTYATDISVASTGSNLNNKIDSLSGSSVLTYSNQTIDGQKTFTEDLVVQKSGFFWSGIKIGLNSVIITDQAIKISGDPVIVQSTFTGYTGDVVNTYATITNLASTGSTLNSNINSLSGTLTSNYATITNLQFTGSNLQTQINNLDNVYATDTSVTAISNNLASTGATLDSKINTLSGSSVLLYGDQSVGGIKTFRDRVYINNLYVTGTETILSTTNNNISSPYLLLNLTGGLTDGGIFFVTGSGLTGINDTGVIFGFDNITKTWHFGQGTRLTDISTLDEVMGYHDLTGYSGYANQTFSTITNLANTGSNLQGQINNLGNTYATVTNLASTGATLQTSINSLSGYSNSTFATIINLNNTGLTLQANINTVSSNLVTTGSTLNSNINALSGTLTSTYATINNLASTGSTLNIKIDNLSGWSASATNLASTGLTLDTKIDNLSGVSVLTFGNQLINGTKTFNSGVVINVQPTGTNPALYITGTWNDANIPYSGLVIDITDTNSKVSNTVGDTSYLLELKKNGSSQIALTHKTNYSTSLPSIHNTSNNLNIGRTNTSLYFGATQGGNAHATLNNTAFTVRNSSIIGWSVASAGSDVGSQDLILAKDLSGVLAQRNGTNPQQFRVYNSTGTNSGEFGLFGWQNNQLVVGSQATSSGISRDVLLTGNNIYLGATGGNIRINQKGQIFLPTPTSQNLSDASINAGTAAITLFNNETTMYGFSSAVATFNNQQVRIWNGATLGFAPNNYGGNTPDVVIQRDAAGILAQRNGTNPQQFRVYNSTGTNSGEFGLFGWQNNNLIIGSQATNSGILRNITITGSGIINLNPLTSSNYLKFNTNQNNAGYHEIGYSFHTANSNSQPVKIVAQATQANGRGYLEFWIQSTGGDGDSATAADKVLTLDGNSVTAWKALGNGSLTIDGSSSTNKRLELATDLPSQAASTLLLKAGNANYINRAGGELIISAGKNAGNGTTEKTIGDFGGAISFRVSTNTGAAGDTNTLVDRARLNYNGLGLNTLNPQALLDISGLMIASGAQFRSNVDIYNSTNPQSLRIFNSTGTNSGEFGLFGWQNNNLIIGSQATNSGILRDTILTGNRVISTVPLIISGADLSGINTNGTQGFRLTSRTLQLLGDTLDTVIFNQGYSSTTQVGVSSDFSIHSPSVNNNTAAIGSTRSIGWWGDNKANVAATPEIRLWRDGSGILALRTDNISLAAYSNGGTRSGPVASGFQFRIYNITGTNTGEFGLFGWQNNNLIIGTQQSQSGILRDLTLTGNNININASGVLNIFDNTNIVGNLTVSGNTTITGHLSAASKSFLIDHPTQIGKKLQYGSLEGPEHGVFVRGKTKSNIIDLPNYWSALVDENSISINLTPISAANNIYVVDYNNQRIITSGNNNNDYFYTVYGERKDIPKLVVEF